MKKTKFNPKNTPTKYTETVPIDAYIHARTGMSDAAIANALGVSSMTFAAWRKRHVPLDYALSKARNGKDGGSETFLEYVYKQLSPDLRQKWDQIMAWQKDPNGITRIKELMSQQSANVRQSLWMHAMVQSNFNMSEACRKTCISKHILDNWTNEDPNFPKILDELHWHKKNFFEGGLTKLVKEKNVLATIFANRTLNKDRGYGLQQNINIDQSVNINVRVVSVDKLNLDLDVRKAIRDAIRALPKASNQLSLDAPAHGKALAAIMSEEDEPIDV